MRFYTRDDGDTAWAPVAMILAVVVVVMLFGYFAWYAPSHTVVGAPTPTVTVNTPGASAQPSTTVVVPSAGTPGPAGPAGASGASGAAGPAGASGAAGEPGPAGAAGASAPPAGNTDSGTAADGK
jgi:hypothetical protein